MNKPDSSPHSHVTKKHKKKEKKRKKDKKHKHQKHSVKSKEVRKSKVRECTDLSASLGNTDTKESVESKEPMIVRECTDLSASIGNTDTKETQECFGPALPPNLRPNPFCFHPNQIIGPVLPAGIKLNANSTETGESDEDDVFGPRPMNNASHLLTSAQIALEQRALEIKLSKFDSEQNSVDTAAREEWMLELPDVGLKSGLSSLKRTFRTKEGPDFSDRSCWTKTPNSSEQLSTSKVAGASRSPMAAQHQTEHDADQEKIAKKIMKRHKREDSLYEIHQKKLKAEKKEKEVNGKTERRPFSRDVDLQLNKIDKNQTKSIVAKAKLLGSRFSTGRTKYL